MHDDQALREKTAKLWTEHKAIRKSKRMYQ